MTYFQTAFENTVNGPIYWKPWNFAFGCSKVSPGCDNCWNLAMARRFEKVHPHHWEGTLDKHGEWTGRVRMDRAKLEIPLKIKKPTVFAVNFSSDPFHARIPRYAIDISLEVMAACPQHVFLMLTKRPENIDDKLFGINDFNSCRALGGGNYLPNLMIGISAESRVCFEPRHEAMMKSGWQGKKFLSLEPLIDACVLTDEEVSQYDWVVIGAETGPRRRELGALWFQDVIFACQKNKVPVFVKSVPGSVEIIREVPK